jgi:heme/copper-type cytochrome/quinol oxidase subunit 4
LSRERRDLRKRKIRKISRKPDESSDQIEINKNALKLKELSPKTKLYYTKVVSGALSGIITGIIFILLPDISPDMWILFLIMGLAFSVAVVRLYLKITPEEVDLKRLIFSGTFTFTLLFVVLSSLIWMIPGPRF